MSSRLQRALGPIGLGDVSALDGSKDVAAAGPPRGASNTDCAGYTPGRYYVCPEAYSSTVANATYTLVVVRNGVEVHRSTGRRGRTDGNTPCSASFPGVVALDL